MKYLLMAICLFLFVREAATQTRRDRVLALSEKVDSLSRLLKQERKENAILIADLKSRVQYLENELNKYDSSYTKTQSELNVVKTEAIIQKDKLETKDQYISRLEKELANAYSNQSVRIGNQYWMTQNLNVTTFRNGDPIPEAKSNAEWVSANDRKQPAWCYYDNHPKNGARYGKLYNFYAVTDPRGLAPKGWKIPAMTDWDTLFITVGGDTEAALKMKNENGWESNGNGTNETGFSAMPGGYRDHAGMFYFPGISGYWWSRTEQNQYNGLSLYANYYFNNVYRSYNNKKCGLSVRCLRD